MCVLEGQVQEKGPFARVGGMIVDEAGCVVGKDEGGVLSLQDHSVHSSHMAYAKYFYSLKPLPLACLCLLLGSSQQTSYVNLPFASRSGASLRLKSYPGLPPPTDKRK